MSGFSPQTEPAKKSVSGLPRSIVPTLVRKIPGSYPRLPRLSKRRCFMDSTTQRPRSNLVFSNPQSV